MSDDRPERPVYVGNYEYSLPEHELRRMFEKYGDIERIDMKTGFAFVYMRHKDDGDYAIRKLDNMECGARRRRLRVQWAKVKETDRKRDVNPSTTLFVVNFDPSHIRTRDLERHFDRYGTLKRVEIKRSYAFVQYDNLEDAKYAMEKTNGSDLEGRTISVEYCQNEEPANRGRGEGEGDRDRDRGDGDRDRDRGRERDRGRRDRSGSRGRRRSPSYDRAARSRSPRERRSSHSNSPSR